jgi:rubrerythrin
MSGRRFRSAHDIIAFAIEREIEAAEGYGRMAAMSETPGLKTFLLELQGDEQNHRKLLENMSDAELRKAPIPQVEDLGLGDALVDEPLASNATLQELLIFAARKEKKAAELYTGLSRISQLASHRHIFEFLAGQERTHKLKIETEYEKRILPEN